MKEGYHLRVGAGNVSFLFEPWSTLGLLCNVVDYVAIHDSDLKVNNVYRESGVDLQHPVTQVESNG